MLGYLLLVVGTIVLAPFRFGIPDVWTLHPIWLGPGWVADLLLNVVLFLPLGFIGRRIPGWEAGSPLRWLGLGALVSLGIEVAQLFLPGRYSTGSDVMANGVGAWCGAWLSDAAVRGLGGGRRAVRRLWLDVPLMGVAYLLLPILWLGGLSVAPGGVGGWLQLPLAAAGGIALAGAARTAEAADRGLAGMVAVFAAVWWLIAAVPTLRVDPIAVTLGFTVAILAANISEPIWRWRRQRERRLEPAVVVVVAALVVFHLLTRGAAAGSLELAGGGDSARRGILAWLQRATSFTLLGYLVAEWGGRTNLAFAPALVAPAVIGGGFGMLLAGELFSVTAWAPPAAAAVLGAALYRLQRDHVIALRQNAGAG